jgi:putative peptidoglycan lipid II flippase
MAKALTTGQIARAALIVLLGFFASGVLGVVRGATFTAAFGAGELLDTFVAAQRIPELIYTLVAGGALGSSFIPVFLRFFKEDESGAKAWTLASAVTTCTTLVALVLTGIVLALAPTLVPNVLLPDDPPAMQSLAISLTQIMLLTVIIFTISGLLMGLLNAQQMFVLPALALSLNNVGQIIGALVFVPLIRANDPANPQNAIYGLAYGVILGAVLHLLVQLPGLRRSSGRLRFLPNFRIAGVREVLTLMLPRVLGLGAAQINFVVNTILTSGMTSGSRSALVYAWTLMFFTLGLIAQSVGTALFPTLSALAASGDMDGFKDRLASALRSVLFLSFPVMAILICLGSPMLSVLYERGAWDATDTTATAWALALYGIGLAGHSLLEVLSRAFYALSDTWTPVLIGIASIVANIVLSMAFIQFIGDPTDVRRGTFGGLALANSLTTIIEGLILWWLLRRRIGGINDGYVLRGAVPALAAALVMGGAILLTQEVISSSFADANTLSLFLGGLLAGAVVFFGLALILRIDEARKPLLLLRQRLKR